MLEKAIRIDSKFISSTNSIFKAIDLQFYTTVFFLLGLFWDNRKAYSDTFVVFIHLEASSNYVTFTTYYVRSFTKNATTFVV
jgi:hypothetical protein